MKFEELLSTYNIESRTEGKHCRRGWVQLDCPFCGKNSGKYHLGYNIQYGYLNCWNCGQHTVEETLAEILDISKGRAYHLTKDIEHELIPVKKKTNGIYTEPDYLQSIEALKPHKQYLVNRGYNIKELIRLWDIQGIGMLGRLKWRIFIPIFFRGEKVSWITRSISSDKSIMRYINCTEKEESINHKHILYGMDYVRHSAIVNEGVPDAWKIGVGAVATLGINITKEQIHLLSKIPYRYICFDNEPAAQNRALKLCEQLAPFPGKTFNIVPSTKDMGEADKKDIELLRKTAFGKRS